MKSRIRVDGKELEGEAAQGANSKLEVTVITPGGTRQWDSALRKLEKGEAGLGKGGLWIYLGKQSPTEPAVGQTADHSEPGKDHRKEDKVHIRIVRSNTNRLASTSPLGARNTGT